MQITVRLAVAGDAQAIARIYNQGIEERVATFETEPRTADAIAALLAERGDRYPSVVAVRDGVVLAWAGSSPHSGRSCYAGIAEFSVYTELDARGRGAGRAALAGLIDACERSGCWKLVSRVFPDNAASRALCARLGFREVGIYERHAQLDGIWRDCVIVEQLLDHSRP